jgi:excinuclease UvrABC ATPase subunit
MSKIKFTHPAIEEVILVDGENVVCPTCKGFGKTERTDIDCSKLVDDMREDGDDEGLESYFKGSYQETCPTCHGSNVIFSPILPEWATKEIQSYYESELEDMMYAEQERICGA